MSAKEKHNIIYIYIYIFEMRFHKTENVAYEVEYSMLFNSSLLY